jgi:hypothetical protein
MVTRVTVFTLPVLFSLQLKRRIPSSTTVTTDLQKDEEMARFPSITVWLRVFLIATQDVRLIATQNGRRPNEPS